MTGLRVPPGSLGPWSGGAVTRSAVCLLAPNASPMTLDGTNTWVIGAAAVALGTGNAVVSFDMTASYANSTIWLALARNNTTTALRGLDAARGDLLQLAARLGRAGDGRAVDGRDDIARAQRTGGRYGLVSMCCGGGLGTGTIIERV